MIEFYMCVLVNNGYVVWLPVLVPVVEVPIIDASAPVVRVHVREVGIVNPVDRAVAAKVCLWLLALTGVRQFPFIFASTLWLF